MSERPLPLSIDPGLLSRFRAAGGKIAWRPASSGRGRSTRSPARIAHLNDEEARVEAMGRGERYRLEVESGPLGALVVLLEADRRGTPRALGASEAGRNTRFPSGSIVAAWGDAEVPHDSVPTLRDLVELARYALA